MAHVHEVTAPAAAPVAVVCDPRGPYADEVRAWLAQAGLAAAAWYAPRDVDHLAAAVQSGGTRQVVWRTPADLLTAVWDGSVAAEAWLAPDVRLAFIAEAVERAALDALLRAWQDAAARRRRGQVVGGVIYSILALLAAATVLLLAR
jgi:hypothetical protein